MKNGGNTNDPNKLSLSSAANVEHIFSSSFQLLLELLRIILSAQKKVKSYVIRTEHMRVRTQEFWLNSFIKPSEITCSCLLSRRPLNPFQLKNMSD